MAVEGVGSGADPLANAEPEEIAALEEAIAAMFVPQIIKNTLKIKETVKEP